MTNFIAQALNDDPLTIYGDGSQTRSFCYIGNLIRGIESMIDCTERGPVNLGNPEELTVAGRPVPRGADHRDGMPSPPEHPAMSG